jgi:hypothetical protein
MKKKKKYQANEKNNGLQLPREEEEEEGRRKNKQTNKKENMVGSSSGTYVSMFDDHYSLYVPVSNKPMGNMNMNMNNDEQVKEHCFLMMIRKGTLKLASFLVHTFIVSAHVDVIA